MQTKKKKGRFKPIELYNLETDPAEAKNVAKKHPEIMAKIEGFMKEAHTPLN